MTNICRYEFGEMIRDGGSLTKCICVYCILNKIAECTSAATTIGLACRMKNKNRKRARPLIVSAAHTHIMILMMGNISTRFWFYDVIYIAIVGIIYLFAWPALAYRLLRCDDHERYPILQMYNSK